MFILSSAGMSLHVLQMLYERKRAENYWKEKARWDQEAHVSQKPELVWQYKRETCQGGTRRNKSSEDYNIINLHYGHNQEGQALRYKVIMLWSCSSHLYIFSMKWKWLHALHTHRMLARQHLPRRTPVYLGIMDMEGRPHDDQPSNSHPMILVTPACLADVVLTCRDMVAWWHGAAGCRILPCLPCLTDNWHGITTG